MLKPEELASYIETLRASGVTGKVKIGDIEVTIAPKESFGPKSPRRSSKDVYDELLFAATEGIRDEDGTS